jgi:hypothetical protein
MLCKFKNIFGKVGTGVHSYRLFDIAIVDVLLTLLLALILKWFIPKYKYIYILISVFIIGIIMHYIFCVDTTVNKFITKYIS